MLYLLNSPVLTSYGKWEFDGPISIEAMRELLANGFTSAIGHQATADLLGALLGRSIPVNRVRIEMQPGDRALVIRILTRMPEGKLLTEKEMKDIPYELGIMTRRQ